MIDLHIVDPDTGGNLPHSAPGEVWFRGPNVIRGYWHDPAADAASFVDGRFRSGDLGYLDDGGLLFVVDDLMDVIIRGVQNIYCAEVEAVIHACPGVQEEAVLGVPHPELGEQVTAVVVVSGGDDHDTSAESLRAQLGKNLAAYKVPTVLVVRVDPLPRTARESPKSASYASSCLPDPSRGGLPSVRSSVVNSVRRVVHSPPFGWE